jgi:transposase InsO family protein
MSVENPLWGAPRIHGKLLKLGFALAQSTVVKYMIKPGRPRDQDWRTFLLNHAPETAAMDLFVVPTIGFRLLYAFIIVGLDRRHLVWIDATTNPTADRVARQITEAFPWDEAPKYLIRDRDGVFGSVLIRRLRAMGIRDRPIAAASRWQNCYAERLIGTIRRECLDHVIVLGEGHLRRLMRAYADYYTRPARIARCARTRRYPDRFSALDGSFLKPSSEGCTTDMCGIRVFVPTAIIDVPILSGLHHQDVRI